jgi:tetratricopeptide (TPR) repeat protein
MIKAADYYNKAIEADPGYALAYAGLALTYVLSADWGVEAPETCNPKAKAAALRAIELDDSLAEPHAALGMYYSHWEWNHAEAERELRRAFELKPNYATPHQWLSTEVFLPLNRLDEAIAEGQRAQELDPLSAIIATRLGYAYFVARRYDDAIAMHRRSLDIDPELSFAYTSLGNSLLAKGQLSEAIASCRKAVAISQDDPWDKSYLAFVLARAGRRDEALKLIEELKHPKEGIYVPAFLIALPYLGLENKDESLTWLEKEADAHGSDGMQISVDPNFDELRNETRFKALLKRMNLPQ